MLKIAYIFSVFVLFSCTTTKPIPPVLIKQPTPKKTEKPSSEETKKEKPPRYQVGDCLMLVDPETGSKPTRHRVRVEKIDLRVRRYWYRWLMDTERWDSELSSAVGKFEVLEKITQKVNCP